MDNGRTARIVTLGCRLNHADSALLATRITEAGYTLCSDPAVPSDLIVVNTCAVTAEAEAKSRRQIARLRRENPGARIIAAGCAVELHHELLLQAGADESLTNPDKKLIFQKPAGLKSRQISSENFYEKGFSSFPFRSRAFIKVQEGCDNFCSYCIVPVVRGASRSRAFDEVLEDCRKNIEAGFPEIILTGVNTCLYRDGKYDFPALIREVAALPGDFRIRLSSTEPHPGDLSIPELMAEIPKLCRFLHVSMQHGCNRILQLMKRRYTAEEFAEFVNAARQLVPDIHIGTDFIVGFPGERDEDFHSALELVKKLEFANIHCFIYSPRPGTPAAAMSDKVPPQIAKLRMEQLRTAAAESSAEFARSQYGKSLPVIFEQQKNGIACGWSDNYLQVTAPADTVPLGKIVNITASKQNISLTGSENP